MGTKHRKPKRQWNNQWIKPAGEDGFWLYWQVTKNRFSRRWYATLDEASRALEEKIQESS